MCRRVYKGIPLQVRGQVWSLLLDVEKMKKENEGKYEVRLQHGQQEQVGIQGGRGCLRLHLRWVGGMRGFPTGSFLGWGNPARMSSLAGSAVVAGLNPCSDPLRPLERKGFKSARAENKRGINSLSLRMSGRGLLASCFPQRAASTSSAGSGWRRCCRCYCIFRE